MPLINTSVPNLIQGVSQQPDVTRFAGQCEEQVNALSSVAEGLKKRPNTRHVGKLLSTTMGSDSFVHFIDRDDSEKYCITQDNNTLRIHNALTGERCTITEQSTTDFTVTNNNSVNTTGTYLESANPRKNIKPLTLGDTTFLLNKEKVAALDPTKTTPDLSDEALVFIKQGDYKKKYGFKIQGRRRNGNGNSASIRVNTTNRRTMADGTQLYKATAWNPTAAPETLWAFIANKGSGFAPNDIVNITLQGSVLDTLQDSGGTTIATGTLNLNITIQPTIKVVTVDADGGITSAVIEEEGAFIYSGTLTGSYGGGVSQYMEEHGGAPHLATVFSSNSSSTEAAGTSATIEVSQSFLGYGNGQYGGYGSYSAQNAGITVANARVKTAGSGFAIGDVLTVTGLPASRLWNSLNPIAPADNGQNPTATADLNLISSPTVRVTGIDGNGGIVALEVADGGRFGYGDYAGWYYDTSSTTNSNTDYFGNFAVQSTNNTAVNVVDTDDFEASRIITSSGASGNNASVIDSSVILNSLSSGSDTNIEGNFDTDTSNTNSNLLIIKPKIIANTGMPFTDYFTITPIDGLSGGGIGVVHREVSSMSDLPLVAPHGYRVKVVGDAELGQDDFYCEFNLSNNESASDGDVGKGTWAECAGAIVTDEIDASTMPRQLVNIAPNIFQLSRMPFGALKAGDENTNPPPSFINKTINNMFQFKNRLGFLCSDSVILSESGFGGYDALLNRQQFNFFRTTVTTLLDSDPIDVTVSSDRVTTLKAAKAFQENLVLFSANGQFVLKGGDLLTPKTISVNAVTNFSFEDQVEPLPLGSYIYFPFTRGKYTGMREFVVNASSETYDALEITEHVPAYIPKNIIDMAGTTSEDIIVLLSDEDKSSLYIYNYFWNNNQKVLSAWSKFTFTGEIRGIEFIESTLYMVMTDDQSNTHLVSLPLEAGLKDLDHTNTSANFLTLLDRRVRVKVASGSRQIQFEKADGTYGLTQADIPYTYYNGGVAGYILPEVLVDSTATTHALTFANIQGNGGAPVLSVAATLDLYGYVGVPYTMKYKFSTQVFKASTGNSSSPTNASAMHVRNGTMFFDDTHTFDVKVTPENRTTATSTFLADDVPEATQLGGIKIAEGNFRFPVYSKAKHADILIENSSPFDSKFSSAEFESFVHPRSQRYG